MLPISTTNHHGSPSIISASGEENVSLELTAAAANVAPGEPVSLEVVLADSTIFLDKAHWFNSLTAIGFWRERKTPAP